jgi:hypothetical protein
VCDAAALGMMSQLPQSSQLPHPESDSMGFDGTFVLTDDESD